MLLELESVRLNVIDERVGHPVLVEAPEEFNTALRQFFSTRPCNKELSDR